MIADEVKPLSGDFQNPFGRWAAIFVDSLDSQHFAKLRHTWKVPYLISQSHHA